MGNLIPFPGTQLEEVEAAQAATEATEVEEVRSMSAGVNGDLAEALLESFGGDTFVREGARAEERLDYDMALRMYIIALEKGEAIADYYIGHLNLFLLLNDEDSVNQLVVVENVHRCVAGLQTALGEGKFGGDLSWPYFEELKNMLANLIEEEDLTEKLEKEDSIDFATFLTFFMQLEISTSFTEQTLHDLKGYLDRCFA